MPRGRTARAGSRSCEVCRCNASEVTGQWRKCLVVLRELWPRAHNVKVRNRRLANALSSCLPSFKRCSVPSERMSDHSSSTRRASAQCLHGQTLVAPDRWVGGLRGAIPTGLPSSPARVAAASVAGTPERFRRNAGRRGGAAMQLRNLPPSASVGVPGWYECSVRQVSIAAVRIRVRVDSPPLPHRPPSSAGGFARRSVRPPRSCADAPQIGG
jgi:hypothetical protein